MSMSKARAAREAIEKIEQAKPKLGQRLLVISACCQCPHSRDTDCCWHPHHPEQVDQRTSPEWCYQKPKPLTDGRPPIDRHQYGSNSSSAPPPPWCPLTPVTP